MSENRFDRSRDRGDRPSRAAKRVIGREDCGERVQRWIRETFTPSADSVDPAAERRAREVRAENQARFAASLQVRQRPTRVS